MKKEFEKVVWIYIHGHMIPMFDLSVLADPNFVSLQNQLDKMQVDKLGPMKITLEWEDHPNAS